MEIKAVLVLERDPDIREVLAEMMRDGGAPAFEAASENEALGLLSPIAHPCLVILGVDLRGSETLHRELQRLSDATLIRVLNIDDVAR